MKGARRAVSAFVPLVLLLAQPPAWSAGEAAPQGSPPGASAAAQPPPQAPGAPPPRPAPGEQAPPAIEPLGNDRYKIGQLIVDRPAREVRFPGAIVLREGVLEYLICSPRGKLYESLLLGDVDPYALQVGLLLIGLKPENNLTMQGDPATPAGDPATIHVTWESGGGKTTVRAEHLVWQPKRQGAMQETNWVFSGSVVSEGQFAASLTRSLVALFNDPTAILNNPLPTGADDTSYVVRTDALPPEGTPVEIAIRAASGKEDKP